MSPAPRPISPRSIAPTRPWPIPPHASAISSISNPPARSPARQAVPEEIAEFFTPVAEARQAADTFLKKHAGSARPLPGRSFPPSNTKSTSSSNRPSPPSRISRIRSSPKSARPTPYGRPTAPRRYASSPAYGNHSATPPNGSARYASRYSAWQCCDGRGFWFLRTEQPQARQRVEIL